MHQKISYISSLYNKILNKLNKDIFSYLDILYRDIFYITPFEYVCFVIREGHISLFHIQNRLVVADYQFVLEENAEVSSHFTTQISDLCYLPVYIFVDTDTIQRVVFSMNHSSFYSRILLKRQFQQQEGLLTEGIGCEIYSSQAQKQKISQMVYIKPSSLLLTTFEVLKKFSLLVVKVDLLAAVYEEHLFNNVSEYVSAVSPWTVVIYEKESTWRILAIHQHSVIMNRCIEFSKRDNKEELCEKYDKEYLIQTMLSSLRYLERLGLTDDAEINLFTFQISISLCVADIAALPFKISLKTFGQPDIFKSWMIFDAETLVGKWVKEIKLFIKDHLLPFSSLHKKHRLREIDVRRKRKIWIPKLFRLPIVLYHARLYMTQLMVVGSAICIVLSLTRFLNYEDKNQNLKSKNLFLHDSLQKIGTAERKREACLYYLFYHNTRLVDPFALIAFTKKVLGQNCVFHTYHFENLSSVNPSLSKISQIPTPHYRLVAHITLPSALFVKTQPQVSRLARAKYIKVVTEKLTNVLKAQVKFMMLITDLSSSQKEASPVCSMSQKESCLHYQLTISY